MSQPAPITNELADEINRLSLRRSPDDATIYRLKKKARDLMRIDAVAAHCALARLELIARNLPAMEEEIRILSRFPPGVQDSVIPMLYIGASDLDKAESSLKKIDSLMPEDQLRIYWALGRFSKAAEICQRDPSVIKKSLEENDISPVQLLDIINKSNASEEQVREAILVFNRQLSRSGVRCHRLRISESYDAELPPLVYEKHCCIDDVNKLMKVRDECFHALAANVLTNVLDTVLFRVDRIALN